MESHVIETEQKSCYQWNTQVKHGMHVIRNKWKGRHLVGFYSGMQFSKYPRIKKEDMNVACTFLLAINIYNMWAHMHCRFLFDVVLACCCWHCFIKCQQERKLTEADCDCGYCNATVWSSYSHSRNIVIALYHLKKERKRRLYRWCRNTLANLLRPGKKLYLPELSPILCHMLLLHSKQSLVIFGHLTVMSWWWVQLNAYLNVVRSWLLPWSFLNDVWSHSFLYVQWTCAMPIHRCPYLHIIFTSDVA